MKIKNNFIYHDIFKSYIFIIIIQLLLSFIESQNCSNCQLSNDKTKCVSDGENCTLCKPYYNESTCIKCEANYEFYSIKNEGSVKTCENKEEGCSSKIMYDTNECVNECPDKYCELGDFCYSSYSFNDYDLNLNTLIILDSNVKPFKECKCIAKYNLTTVRGNKKKYDCIICDTHFYNSDTNECVQSCSANEKKKLYNSTNGETIQTRCSSKCKLNEYLDGEYCLDSCPDGKYKKINNLDLSGECVDKCDIYRFENTNYQINASCVNECNDKEIIVFGNNSIPIIGEPIKYCINRERYTEFFYYNGIYFENCSYTKILFNNIETFPYIKESLDISDTIIETTIMSSILSTLLFQENPQKLCVEDCSNIDSNMFFDGTTCVSKCKDYYYKKKCYEICEVNGNKFYYINFNTSEQNEDIPSFTIIDTTQLMMTDITSNPTLTINKND